MAEAGYMNNYRVVKHVGQIDLANLKKGVKSAEHAYTGS